MLVFAGISPHPPLILPKVGEEEDKKKVQKTIASLRLMETMLCQSGAEEIIISSPHEDWGFEVPLFFLNPKSRLKVKTFLTDLNSPAHFYEVGQGIYKKHLDSDRKVAVIASADLSHCLDEKGPYGFHENGPEFDRELITSLLAKDVKHILELDEKYPNASECGLRSICLLLGILSESKREWSTEILSYESPFGVGYLVANLKLK